MVCMNRFAGWRGWGGDTQSFFRFPTRRPFIRTGWFGQAGVPFHPLLSNFWRKESDYLKIFLEPEEEGEEGSAVRRQDGQQKDDWTRLATV